MFVNAPLAVEGYTNARNTKACDGAVEMLGSTQPQATLDLAEPMLEATDYTVDFEIESLSSGSVFFVAQAGGNTAPTNVVGAHSLTFTNLGECSQIALRGYSNTVARIKITSLAAA